MNPAADTRARRAVISIKDLAERAPSTFLVADRPALVFRRTDDELAALRETKREPRDPISGDRDQPVEMKNWHRSLRPHVMVCVGSCTRDAVPVRRWPGAGELQCPACGSKFDLAGRVFYGPARRNLLVPRYRFITESDIEFIEGDLHIKA